MFFKMYKLYVITLLSKYKSLGKQLITYEGELLTHSQRRQRTSSRRSKISKTVHLCKRLCNKYSKKMKLDFEKSIITTYIGKQYVPTYNITAPFISEVLIL